MRTYKMELIDRHPVVHFPNGLTLIDTGSPMSIPAPAIVSETLGRTITSLRGTDQLRQKVILLDYVSGRYVENFPRRGGQVIPVETVMGVPRVDLQFKGETFKAFLDSGAKLSYVDQTAVAGMTPVGKEQDFYPGGIGTFEVDVYEFEITVAARTIAGRFGVLPDLLKLALSLAGLEGSWILGADAFVNRRIVLDLARDRIIDVTDVPASGEPAETANIGAGDRSAKMRRAYDAASLLLDAELSADDRALIQALGERSVVVVKGAYDRVEDVLRLANIPHQVVTPEAIGNCELTPEQLVIVNCPGKIDEHGLSHLRRFVEAGGSLVTTDWALKHVVEKAFPGYIEYNDHSTGDEVVRIEVRDGSNPWLSGMFSESSDPLWWLEGASYPIRIIDAARVNILLASAELGERYGESPVAVSFNYGEGDVLHMISHYYLQRAELRTVRHKKNWKTYAREVGAERVADGAPRAMDDLSVSEVEAAHKSLRFMTNMVIEKQRKNRRR